MIATPPASDLPSHIYARLLQELHALIHAGRGDTPVADAVRDAMDAPWNALTEAEQDRLGGLSEDLYDLAAGNTARVRLTPAERVEWAQTTGEALRTQNWDRLLELLRHAPEDVPADRIRLAQGWCWEQLDEPEVALLFRRQAGELNPTSPNGAPQDAWTVLLKIPV
jgi:hypothetical protein